MWMLSKSGLRVSCLRFFNVLEFRYPELMRDPDLHHIQWKLAKNGTNISDYRFAQIQKTTDLCLVDVTR